MICFRAGLLFGGTWTGVRNGLTATLWNSVTCKILHLGANNPTQYYRLGPGWRERSLTDKYLKVLMKKTENESSVHLWNTDKNWQPGCISKSVLIRSRKAILLCSCETTSQAHVKDGILHLNHFNYSKLTSSRCAISSTVSSFGLPSTRMTLVHGVGPVKVIRLVRWGEWNTWCARRGCEKLWGLSSFKRRRLREDLTYLVGGHREDEASSSWRYMVTGLESMDTSWSMGDSPMGPFNMIMRKHWKTLPRGSVESPHGFWDI